MTATAEPIVWIVDREQWPRACLRAELIERGYDTIGWVDLRDALAALARPEVPRPSAIVLELGGEPPPGAELDALERAGIPVVALAGALERTDPRTARRPWARLLARPITLGKIADEIEALVRSKT
jgi:DNA-binding response OmpR family regulator